MDLRDKPNFLQRLSEASIRFRLPLLLVMLIFYLIHFFSPEDFFKSLKVIAASNSEFIAKVIDRGFAELQSYLVVAFAILIIVIFRIRFFGLKCGLTLFLFLPFCVLFLLAMDEYSNLMGITFTFIGIFVITGFFFVRSLLIKSMLPQLLLMYAFSDWLLFLGVSGIALVLMIAIYLADFWHLIFYIKCYLSNDEPSRRKTYHGALSHGVRKTIPLTLIITGLLIVLDCIFYFLKMPLIASSNPVMSAPIYLSYALWMPFFTSALLSLCPMENTCEKIQQKRK